MGFTTTTNYGLKKPNPFEEEDSWGPILNANWDTVDTQIKARADAIALKQDANTKLTALAAVTAAADALPYFTGSTTASTTVLTAAGRALIDDADAAAQRNTLGLSTMAVQASNSVSITGGSVTGITDLTVADGGTGVSTLTANAVLLGNGASPVQTVSGLGNAGELLSSNGPSAAPTWKPAAVVFASGTRLLFQQTAAPTGWTKDTSQNDKALRVVSGAVGSGGTVAFSTAFANKAFSGSTSSETVTGTVGSTTLDISQIPSHTHYVASGGGAGAGALSGTNYVDFNYFAPTSAYSYTLYGTSAGADRGLASYNGGSGGHTHTFSGGAHAHSFSGAIDMAVQYIDLIIASKD